MIATHIKKARWSVLFVFMFSVFSTVRAIEITIEQGVENPIPVAIVPFRGAPIAPDGIDPISAIIVKDLRRSARFDVMDTNDLPERPSRFQDINFRNWRLLGMENLVIGKRVQRDDGFYHIEFRLINVYKEKQLAGFQLKSSGDQLRMAAHELSDIIYEKLIGVRGAFSTRIAYITVKKRDDGKKLYALQIADADGYNPKILLESTEPVLSPSWSPDGDRIAYVSLERRNSAIFIQDIGTGQREKIAAHAGINSAPAWSPDGTRMAMTLSKDGDPEIYVMELSTKQLQRITTHKAIDTEPHWSGDGKKIVFTSDRSGGPQVYELEPYGDMRPRRLTFDGSYNARPRYSADGQFIAMVTSDDGKYRIAKLDLNDGVFDILTRSHLDESPSIAPNDHMILYTSSDDNGTALAAVSADGRIRQRLFLQDGEVREPAWGPFSPRR